MAQIPYGRFDANEVEPSSPIIADPDFTGWHLMHAVESENKIAKSGRGEYLQFTCEVIEGKFKGRKLWARFNLVNENQPAAEIAGRNFSALCRACKRMVVSDSTELHHIPFLGHVEFVEAEGKYSAKNELTEGAYKPADGPVPSTAPPPAPKQNSSTPAWAKKAS